jgi:hypothetical protein
VPTIEAVWPLAEELIAPNGRLNRDVARGRRVEEGVGILMQLVLCDGRLRRLFTPSRRSGEAPLEALGERGTPAAAVIGEVEEEAGTIWVEG